ncbi:MAG TPA: hypothetical protein VGA49_01300 [Patescibacteria group bacterium]
MNWLAEFFRKIFLDRWLAGEKAKEEEVGQPIITPEMIKAIKAGEICHCGGDWRKLEPCEYVCIRCGSRMTKAGG